MTDYKARSGIGRFRRSPEVATCAEDLLYDSILL